MITISDISVLEQTLEKENQCIVSLESYFQDLKEIIVNKGSIESINPILLKIEKKANEFQQVENLRDNLTREICIKNRIENNLESVINFFAKDQENIALLLSQMVRNLKDLVYEVNLLSELISFQSTLNDFIYKILSGNSVTQQKTYDKTGKDLDLNLPSKEWRG
ncbi:MAG TPA: flagellar export chaperone FlgN [Defluviitoga sp.]|nr:flagellar export chaperone FlgN [Defluviitoga sp.]HOP24600.1 flagellar export chaperone FlgN [Defluviitoga sp.]HPZ29408.1 flagellar export chaperone FlgN [Defluviitoga sp.]HQD63329.1 flagellar export chaperone FlgN [Defluviitoga sp.]